MLVVTRRLGEKLAIGDDITVTLVAIHGHQVRLGISAPKDIPVHREEVQQRILLEQSEHDAD